MRKSFGIFLISSLIVTQVFAKTQTTITVDASMFPGTDRKCSEHVSEMAKKSIEKFENDIVNKSTQIILDAYQNSGSPVKASQTEVILGSPELGSKECFTGESVLMGSGPGGFEASGCKLVHPRASYVQVTESSGLKRTYPLDASEANGYLEFFFSTKPSRVDYRDTLGHIVKTEFICSYGFIPGNVVGNQTYSNSLTIFSDDPNGPSIGEATFDNGLSFDQIVVETLKP